MGRAQNVRFWLTLSTRCARIAVAMTLPDQAVVITLDAARDGLIVQGQACGSGGRLHDVANLNR